MDFIDKEDVPFFQIGEETGQVAGFFNHGTGSHAHITAQFVAENKGEGGLAQSRWPGEENVVEWVAPFFGGAHHDLQAFDGLGLTGKVAE